MSSTALRIYEEMRTILIVDDQASVRATLEYVFVAAGYAVRTACEANAALEIAMREPVDAALIDLHMPGTDGATLCRSLRHQVSTAGREFPVWMMTAARTPTAVTIATQAGARALLSKPFEYSPLFAEIDSLPNASLLQ